MRPTVAIIDPNANTRQTLRRLLGALDVEVLSFETAESFLAQPPRPNGQALACLIADVSLPGMSGLALLQRVRASDRDLPIVILADEAEVAMAVEAMRHGATDFIEKPQLDVALLRRVSQLLRHNAARSASA
jgi:FixJ family two-component response regulator